MTELADQPSFARFAAAMDAARDARAPQLALYDDAAAAAQPAVGRVAPWRMLRRPIGIGGGVALVVALLLTLLTPPMGAAIDWLTGPAPVMPGKEGARTAPSPAAQSAARPAAPSNELDVAARPVEWVPEGRVTRVTALAATARPSAQSLPVPSFKPPAAAR